MSGKKSFVPESEYQLLSVNQAAQTVHLDKRRIADAIAVYKASEGRDGLAHFTEGNSIKIRAGALLEWMKRRELKEVA